MKKLLLLFIVFISCGVAAQDAKFSKVNINIDRKLYPVEGEDSYSSSNSLAIIGATYMDGDFSRAESILQNISDNIMLQDSQRLDFTSNNSKVLGVTGNVLKNVQGHAMYMELYLIEAKGLTGNNGVILIMSGYPVAEKAVYGAEGKKAALSASVTQ